MDNPLEGVGDWIGDAVYDATHDTPGSTITYDPARISPPPPPGLTTGQKVAVGGAIGLFVASLIYLASNES